MHLLLHLSLLLSPNHLPLWHPSKQLQFLSFLLQIQTPLHHLPQLQYPKPTLKFKTIT